MEDQQLFKGNLAMANNENMYFQQLQNEASSQSLDHSYDSLDTNESSSSSPHLSQESAVTKSVRPVDGGGPDNWTYSGSGNHVQERSHLNSYDQSLSWNSQNEVIDSFQLPCFNQLSENRCEMTSGALHKLDSFTKVFARQNLRNPSASQGLHEQTCLLDSDSALRQLLSVKPGAEQPTLTAAMNRYPQMQPNLANTPQKQQMQAMQNPQQHIYYEYPQHVNQLQSQSIMQQQQQQYLQQMQSHQVLPQQAQQMQQSHYYMQAAQSGQQRASSQEIQQQRQFSGQAPQYYHSQTARPELHHTVQSLHHQMQMQTPLYHRDCNQKTEYFQQDQAQPMQLIQLGSVPQYAYQHSQPFRHMYKQNLAPQQQSLHQESSQQKLYESQPQVIMETAVGFATVDTVDNYNSHNVEGIGNTVSQNAVLAQDSSFMVNSRGPHPSSTAAWPQILSDVSLPTVSPDHSQHRGLYSERPDSKNRLTCSMCFKEFKSLPALNGHLRSHGGVRPSNLKQEEGEKQQASKVDSVPPVVMPVSVPVTLSLSEPSPHTSCREEREQPESCVFHEDMPVLTRMSSSPPSSPKAVSSCASSEIISKLHQSCLKSGNSESLKPQQEKRKYRHRPEPLFIPPPSFTANSFYSGATLYQSQLRSPRVLVENLLAGTQELPTYTPPPMLSPVRQGSGLFSSVITAIHNAHLPLTPLTPSPRVLLGRPNIDTGSTTVTPGPGEQTIDVEPRINIGSRFQADIPELQGPSSLEKEVDNATLVWKPLADLENREPQQRVDVYLSMSCSSVLPGGGTNLEYALHVLYECKGNITRALETLLWKTPHRLHNHPLANYHYAGSDKWTATEKKNFKRALHSCNKDFFHVQKMIKSKTVSQCVEYYYTWKKILHLGSRHRTRLAEVNEDGMTSGDDYVDEDEELEDKRSESGCDLTQKSPDLRHALDLPRPPGAYSASPIGSFVCEMGNCGAIFCSRQALNGHARIHGGTSVPSKVFPAPGSTRTKSNTQTGYGSVKSSPAHSNTSGETDTSTIFPCKVCGKVFFKIKSRNAHMKTHRQQEEQQRQKAQKAAVAAEMADTIARTIVRTTVPAEHILPFNHLSLVKSMEQDFDNDVAQDLEDVLEDTDIIHADLLLDDEDTDLLQDAAVL